MRQRVKFDFHFRRGDFGASLAGGGEWVSKGSLAGRGDEAPGVGCSGAFYLPKNSAAVLA